jgi:hypothetical protein
MKLANFSLSDAQNERLFVTFAIRNLIFLELSQQFIGTTSKFHNDQVHMIKRWLPAHTLWGMSAGGIRQYHVRAWNP